MNTMVNLLAYFGMSTCPWDTREFAYFWRSCSEKERQYYRHVDLQTGELPEYAKALIDG